MEKKMLKIMVDGKEVILGEAKGIMKNWGPFFDWLTDLWKEYDKLRTESSDPYRQYMYNEQKAIIVSMRQSYEAFLGMIANRHFDTPYDVALPWLADIEAKIEEVKVKSRMQAQSTTIRDPKDVQKPDYIGAAYRGQLKVLKRIQGQFKGFILEE